MTTPNFRHGGPEFFINKKHILIFYKNSDTQKLGIWIPDGDASSPGLLKFALNETNFENSMVALVVSMSTPWSIIESLNKWAKILTDHINRLDISDTKRNVNKKMFVFL